MKRTFGWNSWILMLPLVALTLGACSQPPSEELSTAQQAIDSALAAEADLYAVEQFEEASADLQFARDEVAAQDSSFVLARDYTRARELLTAASAKAQTAVATAQQNKQQTMAEVEALIAETSATLEATMVAFQEAPRGKGTEEDIAAIQAELDSLMAGLESAKALAAEGNYLEAKTTLSDTSQRTTLIATQLQRATTRVGGSRS